MLMPRSAPLSTCVNVGGSVADSWGAVGVTGAPLPIPATSDRDAAGGSRGASGPRRLTRLAFGDQQHSEENRAAALVSHPPTQPGSGELQKHQSNTPEFRNLVQDLLKVPLPSEVYHESHADT